MDLEPWTQMPLGEFVTLQRGHDLPETSRRPGEVPILGSFGLTGWHDEAKAHGPGVTIGRSGASFGTVAFSDVDYWPLNTALYVREFHGNDERFAYYLLKNIDFGIYNSGSAQPSLNRNFIYPIMIWVPPVSEQHAIAHILGSLDDKIELNRKMNQTLDAMARAIFKSWFVDFDPVRAKVEGRAPVGMDPETAALFPAEFEESELGPVPKGWLVRTIGHVVEIYGGGTPDTKNQLYWEGGTHPWATPKDLARLSVPVLLNTERRISDLGLAHISSPLLPLGTVLMSSRAPIGYLAVTEVPTAINQGFIAMVAKVGMSNLLVLNWVRHSLPEILSRANGSTFLEISKASFRPIPFVVPSSEVIAAFDLVVRPFYERLVSNERESATLQSIREALLPKLISGKVRVPGAEKLVGSL